MYLESSGGSGVVEQQLFKSMWCREFLYRLGRCRRSLNDCGCIGGYNSLKGVLVAGLTGITAPLLPVKKKVACCVMAIEQSTINLGTPLRWGEHSLLILCGRRCCSCPTCLVVETEPLNG